MLNMARAICHGFVPKFCHMQQVVCSSPTPLDCTR